METDARTGLGLLAQDCFVQQMPDLGSEGEVLDPLCGKVSHRAHDGWDIRLRSPKDIGRAPVVSAAEGTVVRIQDGIPDWIIDRFQDKELLGGQGMR